MTELLQFMYQGVVNVKHTELNSFMKIAQQLQIKGLATTSSSQPAHQSQTHHHPQKSPANSPVGSYGSKSALDNYPFHPNALIGQKRPALDYLHSESGAASKKTLKRSPGSVDNDISTESMDNLSSDDGFHIPQISMVESSRFDLPNVKRENDSISSPGSARNLTAPFNFEYNSECSIDKNIFDLIAFELIKLFVFICNSRTSELIGWKQLVHC